MEREINQITTNIKAHDKMNVMNFKYGELFKGHTGKILYKDYGSDRRGILSFSNKYYDSLIKLDCHLDNNITSIEVSINQKKPQYMQKFFETITYNELFPLSNKISNELYTNNSKLNYNNDIFNLTYTVWIEGICPLGHFDNISIAKKIRENVSRFKSIIRQNYKDLNFCRDVVEYTDDVVYLNQSLYT